MNPGNIAALAAGAGFSGNDVDIAAAVAMAESDGNPQAFNPEGSYGLWQIYLPDHPEFATWNLYDPQTNAQAAYRVYAKAGGRFTPWSAFKNKSYLAFLAPLTIDAGSGQPISLPQMATPTGEPFPVDAAQASLQPTEGLSFGKVLLWAAAGLFALWIFEEAA